MSRYLKLWRVTLWLTVAGLVVFAAWAQRADPDDPQNIERGAELLRAAIAARGGERYLQFKTLRATGQYTPFDQGMSTIPIPFLDYIVYPDQGRPEFKERTEFGKKKKDRRIQVNFGNQGWVYDGEAQTLKDQTEKQIAEFLENLTYDLDRLLRGGWQEPGVEVRFWGRAETRPGERADVVVIKLDPQRSLYLMLDRFTHLPLTLSYEKPTEKGLSKYEVRFFQYVTYDGVKFPNIVDFYRDGVQLSRVNYENVEINVKIDDSLFVKPDSIKAFK